MSRTNQDAAKKVGLADTISIHANPAQTNIENTEVKIDSPTTTIYVQEAKIVAPSIRPPFKWDHVGFEIEVKGTGDICYVSMPSIPVGGKPDFGWFEIKLKDATKRVYNSKEYSLRWWSKEEQKLMMQIDGSGAFEVMLSRFARVVVEEDYTIRLQMVKRDLVDQDVTIPREWKL